MKSKRAELLMAKAKGFLASISKMSVSDKPGQASKGFGEDYNHLREIVEKEFADLIDVLPPSVHIVEYSGGFWRTVESYAEIAAYCEQIYQLLSVEIDS